MGEELQFEAITFDDIGRVARTLEAMVSGLDVDTLTGEGATRLVKRLVVHERVVATVRAKAAKRAADANQWRHAGQRSPASWLASLTGTTTGQAAADLETTKKLVDLPATAAARAAGQLSDSQARQVADAATADPAAEADLLAHATTDDAAALARRCLAVKAAAERDETAARERLRRARRHRSWTDGEGAFCYAGRGLPEDQAAVEAALKPYQDQAFHNARRRGEREPAEAYAYDALIALANHQCPTTETRSAGVSPTEATSNSDAGHTRTRATSTTSTAVAATGTSAAASRSSDDDTPGAVTLWKGITTDTSTTTGTEVVSSRLGSRAKVIVRIDHTALVRGDTVPGEVCEIAGTGPIPVATARKMARDASLTAVVTDGVDVRTVAHLGRAATAHQRTALEARGVHCAVPGCGAAHHLEIDHVDGWALTRRTQLTSSTGCAATTIARRPMTATASPDRQGSAPGTHPGDTQRGDTIRRSAPRHCVRGSRRRPQPASGPTCPSRARDPDGCRQGARR